MKKILILLFIFIITFTSSYATDAKDYIINFDGTKYHLLYSVKNKEYGGYLNEYYKKGETYNIWTDMVAVHHFPNAYSPIDRIKDFKEYLSSMNVPSSLTFDDKNNTAMIDFIMITSNHMPIVLEFNIFKYEKSPKCGSIAIQYVKRYAATTTMQIEAIKKDFEKNRNHLIKEVKNFKIPKVITQDIDKCISGIEVNSKSTADMSNQENISDIDKITTEQSTNETANHEISENISENNDIELKNDDNSLNEHEEITTDNNEKEIAQSQPEGSNDETILNKEEETEYNIKETLKETVQNSEQNNKSSDIENDITTNSSEAQIHDVKSEPIENSDIKNLLEENSDINNKKVKESSYILVNNKEDYIATPRTKNELKNEVKIRKENQKKNIKQAKLNAKNAKIIERQNIKNNKLQEKQNIANEKLKAKNAKKLDKQKAKELKKQNKQNLKEDKKLQKETRIEEKKELRYQKIENKKIKKSEIIQAKIDKKLDKNK